MKDENYIIIAKDAERAFDETQFPFIIFLILRKLGLERSFLNLIKGICEKSTASNPLNSEALNIFSLRSGTSQEYLLSPLPFSIVLEVLSRATKKKKGNKKHKDWKGRHKDIFIHK